MTAAQAADVTLSFTTPARLAGGILFYPSAHNLMAIKMQTKPLVRIDQRLSLQ
jgi:hypothetical protein